MMTVSLKHKQKSVRHKRIGLSPAISVIQQACDEFIELRREIIGSDKNRPIGAWAKIGGRSLLVLLHCRSAHRNKRSAVGSAYHGTYEFRKTQHLIRLAQKFKRPVLVCFVDPSTSPSRAATDWNEVLELSGHLLTEWLLDVPIILLVLTVKSSCSLFGAWLADQVVAIHQARFVVSLHGRGGSRLCEVPARQLVSSGIIDRTIDGAPTLDDVTGKTMPSRLRNALIHALNEAAGRSPKELVAGRQDKLARVEALVASLCEYKK